MTLLLEKLTSKGTKLNQPSLDAHTRQVLETGLSRRSFFSRTAVGAAGEGTGAAGVPAALSAAESGATVVVHKHPIVDSA